MLRYHHVRANPGLEISITCTHMKATVNPVRLYCTETRNAHVHLQSSPAWSELIIGIGIPKTSSCLQHWWCICTIHLVHAKFLDELWESYIAFIAVENLCGQRVKIMVEQPLHNISNDLSNAVQETQARFPSNARQIKGLDFTDWFERLPCKISLKLLMGRVCEPCASGLS